ncbi:MAG: diguanylate cyclase [Myxococcales bacterium]
MNQKPSLKTTYLGIDLPHPLVPGASPIAQDLELVKRAAEAGAPMITMHSLFEEQIVGEQVAAWRAIDQHAHAFPEALTYFPDPEEYALGPEEYLEQIHRIKEATGLPVVGSLNGITLGVWLDYARQMVQAGCDALELNVYQLVTNPEQDAADVEERTIEVVAAVKEVVSVPVAVKLSPFYTSLPNFARALCEAGADGIVLFNRFYQPDIDVEELEVRHELHLSTSEELNLRLRWLAVLSGRVDADLAVTGGVHTGLDAIKAIMAGADLVQMVSALLLHGPERLRVVLEDMRAWLQEHDYASLDQARGSMSLLRCPDPRSYERANYMKMLRTWGR